MQLLMTSVDSLQQDTYRLLGYEKQLAKNSQAKIQLLQKKVPHHTTLGCRFFFLPAIGIEFLV